MRSTAITNKDFKIKRVESLCTSYIKLNKHIEEHTVKKHKCVYKQHKYIFKDLLCLKL